MTDKEKIAPVDPPRYDTVITSGGNTVVSSGTVFSFGSEPIEINIAADFKIKFVNRYKDDKDNTTIIITPSLESDGAVTVEFFTLKTMLLSPHRITLPHPVTIGRSGKNQVYLMAHIDSYKLPAGTLSFILTYTVFMGRADGE